MEMVEIRGGIAEVSHKIIAEHTNNKSTSIARIIYNYLQDFELFGNVSFEMTSIKNSKNKINEEITYYLNEQQATLLLTYLRNSEIVRKFKVTLVKEFYELKERNTVPYELLYSKERECIELKRAMNRITENEKLIFNDPQTHNEVLDLIGYASRATKTIKHLGQELLEYGTNMEAKLASIQKKHANKNGVTSQCNRLPRHQERRD